MSRGINKAILIGNLGADPDTHTFPDGGMVANVSLATSSAWKDKHTGELQERTEWHRVVFRQRLAEIVAQYLTKGAKIYVEGAIQTRKWQDGSGQDRYTTEIIGFQMQMLDSAKGDQGPGGQRQPDPTRSARYQQGQAFRAQGGANGMRDDGFDDDIPF